VHWHSEKLSQVISEVFNGVDTYLQRLQDCCFAHRWDAMPELCISYLSFLLSLFCKSSLSTQIDHFETIFLFLIIRSQTGLFTLTLTVHICMQIHQRLDKSRIFVVVGAFTVPILPWNDYFFLWQVNLQNLKEYIYEMLELKEIEPGCLLHLFTSLTEYYKILTFGTSDSRHFASSVSEQLLSFWWARWSGFM